jgi:hypothetical protein
MAKDGLIAGNQKGTKFTERIAFTSCLGVLVVVLCAALAYGLRRFFSSLPLWRGFRG